MTDKNLIKRYSAERLIVPLEDDEIEIANQLCEKLVGGLDLNNAEQHILCMLSLGNNNFGINAYREAIEDDQEDSSLPDFLSPMVSLVVLKKFFESETCDDVKKRKVSLMLKNAAHIHVRLKKSISFPEIVNEMMSWHTDYEADLNDNRLRYLQEDTKQYVAHIVFSDDIDEIDFTEEDLIQLKNISCKAVSDDYNRLLSRCANIKSANPFEVKYKQAKILVDGMQLPFYNDYLFADLFEKDNKKRSSLKNIRTVCSLPEGMPLRKTSLVLRYLSKCNNLDMLQDIQFNLNEFLVVVYYELMAEKTINNENYGRQ